MSDEVSQRFVSALAILDGDRPACGVANTMSAPQYSYFAVGRLLTLKRKMPDPKAVIGTLTSDWDLQNRLQPNEGTRWYVCVEVHQI